MIEIIKSVPKNIQLLLERRDGCRAGENEDKLGVSACFSTL